MEKFYNNCTIEVEYIKGRSVLLKKEFERKDWILLNDCIEEYKCKAKAEIRFAFDQCFRVIIQGKNNIEMLQNEDFKTLLHNPDFNVLENL